MLSPFYAIDIHVKRFVVVHLTIPTSHTRPSVLDRGSYQACSHRILMCVVHSLH
jgi:hypothetical protein